MPSLVKTLEAMAVRIDAGGQGSGCHGDNCGRPAGSGSKSGGGSTSVGKKAPIHADVKPWAKALKSVGFKLVAVKNGKTFDHQVAKSAPMKTYVFKGTLGNGKPGEVRIEQSEAKYYDGTYVHGPHDSKKVTADVQYVSGNLLKDGSYMSVRTPAKLAHAIEHPFKQPKQETYVDPHETPPQGANDLQQKMYKLAVVDQVNHIDDADMEKGNLYITRHERFGDATIKPDGSWETDYGKGKGYGSFKQHLAKTTKMMEDEDNDERYSH